MFIDSVRIVVVFVTFALITTNCFQQFASSLQGSAFAEHSIFIALQCIIALTCGGIITNLLMSLWQGTSFVKDVVDYEPDVNYL